MRRVLLLPTFALLLLFVMGFALSAGPFTSARAAERPIVILTADDIKTLDVSKMSWANDIRMAMALWEGLAVYDMQNNLKPIPGAAKSWEISPDGLTYTFHLRPEAKWSNGDPVTADDFIFSWKRALTPVTGADYIGFFRSIEGAEEYAAAWEEYGKKRDELVKSGGDPATLPPVDASRLGLVAVDAHTLRVKLKMPCTYFIDLLAMPVMFPLHRASMEEYREGHEADGYDPRWTLPGVVTNGPYTLKEWVIKQSLTMDPNPHYWDRANVQAPRLIVKPVADSRSSFMMFQSGDADFLTFIPPEFKTDLYEQHVQEGKWPELHAMPAFGTYYYIFNCMRKPFDDPRVRRALALVIDRKVPERLLNTGEKALGLLVPPGSINGYESPPEMTPNIEEARRLLADAGFPGGKGLKSIELLYNTEALHAKVAQAVGQMWKTQLGVDVTYKGLERGSFNSARRRDKSFDIARGGWYGDYPDPTTWLDLFRSTDGNNDGKYASKEFDALMARSDAETDSAKRFALLRQAEQMLLDDAAFIPLYQYAEGSMYDPNRIEGVEMNVRNMTALKWIRRK